MHVPGVARMEGGNCSNKAEEGVVIKIIEVVRKMMGYNPSIGVITFYAKQKQVIHLEVQNKKLGDIVVNTVDGFQGSKRDTIIISCVRGDLGHWILAGQAEAQCGADQGKVHPGGGWQHGHLAGDSSPVFIFYFNLIFSMQVRCGRSW